MIYLKKPWKRPLQQHDAGEYKNGVVDSESDRETRESAYAQRKGRVVEDERGRQIWQDTIADITLSLMKTGVFFMSKAQEGLLKLRQTGSYGRGNDLDAELDIIDDSGGFAPYDSSSKTGK